jgi:hypothetical protein
MTISDVNEQGYCYQLVMLMDRVYHFIDVNSLSAMDGHDRPLKN